MLIHDVTITAAGTLLSRRQHETDNLAPQAVDFFRRMLRNHGRLGEWRRPLPMDLVSHLDLYWTSTSDAHALATFMHRQGDSPLTTSLLLTGADPAGGRDLLTSVQRQLVTGVLREVSGGAVEPGFDLLGVQERPLLATVVMAAAAPYAKDLPMVADMETCLAAAFFAK